MYTCINIKSVQCFMSRFQVLIEKSYTQIKCIDTDLRHSNVSKVWEKKYEITKTFPKIGINHRIM